MWASTTSAKSCSISAPTPTRSATASRPSAGTHQRSVRRARPRGERDCQRQQARHRRDEETPRRRLQMPTAAAHQDGCRGEGKGGEALRRSRLTTGSPGSAIAGQSGLVRMRDFKSGHPTGGPPPHRRPDQWGARFTRRSGESSCGSCTRERRRPSPSRSPRPSPRAPAPPPP